MSIALSLAPARAVLPPAFAERLGLVALSAAAAGLGLLALIYRDFALQWQPVPESVHGRELLALINGQILIALAVLLWLRRTRAESAFVLGAYLILWALALHLPLVVAGAEAAWNGMAEAAAIGAGALVLAAQTAGREQGARAARLVFAFCLPVFGAAHFLYADFTASMVPSWIPAPLFWAYATGAGHVAAGISLLLNLLPRLGASLYALMISSFVLLLHAPRVLAAPADRLEWTMLCIALALAGASWSVAASLRRA